MALAGKQKKYLKRNLQKRSLNQIASHLGVSSREIEAYLKKIWGEKKFQKFISRKSQKPTEINLKEKILSFNFKTWFKKNSKPFGFLTLLVFIAYVNSLGNDFVSDDIPTIVKNENLGRVNYVFTNPLIFLRLLFYFVIFKIFGLSPIFFRMINLVFHLGTVLTSYLLLSLLIDSETAFFAASLFAVHPLLTEAVTWISGGPYSQYSFFLLLSFLFYLLSSKEKIFFVFSIISFFLSLVSSEKAVVFPLILFVFSFAFENIRKTWKKLIPFFAFAGLFGLAFLSKAPARMSALQISHYQTPQLSNPLVQIPIAITSYLELFLWPKNLTLYHSELRFSQLEFSLRFTVFVFFLGLIVWSYKHNRQVFFWLVFFIASLLPTLTPFGISWIVAERYVYLGAIGIFVVTALAFQKLTQIKKLKTTFYVLFALIIIAFSLRTIVRNVDWKNQDNLWLAAARTSPSSPQNHNNLGDLYGRRGDYDRAVEEFKKAIELKPGYADAYHNLANTYKQMGEIDQAIENYQKAIEFNPNLWQSYQNLSAIYFQKEKFGLAQENLEKAIKINPQDPNLHTNLGILYLKTGDQGKAKKEFQKALQLDPQNQRARQGLLGVEREE